MSHARTGRLKGLLTGLSPTPALRLSTASGERTTASAWNEPTPAELKRGLTTLAALTRDRLTRFRLAKRRKARQDPAAFLRWALANVETVMQAIKIGDAHQIVIVLRGWEADAAGQAGQSLAQFERRIVKRPKATGVPGYGPQKRGHVAVFLDLQRKRGVLQ